MNNFLKLKNYRLLKIICILASIIFLMDCNEIDSKLLDPYKVLGIARDSTQQQIKSRFRQLSKQFHPDKINKQQISAGKSHQDQKTFQSITQAYQMLKNNGFMPIIDFQSEPEQDHSNQNEKGFSTNIDLNLIKMKIFFDEFTQQQQEKMKYKQRQRQKHKSVIYMFFYGFLVWSIKNEQLFLGSFLISVGLLIFINTIKRKKSNNKEIQLNEVKEVKEKEVKQIKENK